MNQITFGKDQYHLNGKMQQWCKNTLGPPAYSVDNIRDDGDRKNLWTYKGIFGNTTYFFKNEKDYTMFILRWS